MNKQFIFVSVLMLAVTLTFAALITPTYADSKKTVVNNCVIDRDTGKCEVKQIYKTRNGDIDVTNNIDASAILGGGSGNGSTVDSVARASNIEQDQKIGDLQENQTKLIRNETDDDKEFKILVDRVGQQADTINTLLDNNATLFEMLSDAVIDVDGSNATAPGTNSTIPEVPTDNQTNTGGNTTIPTDGNVTQPTDNQTGDFNFNMTD
jgi:hypothetical protein